MKNNVTIEISKAIFLALSIVIIIYIEHSRYERKANQFDLDESAKIHHDKNYLIKSSLYSSQICPMYTAKLSKTKTKSYL